jgi:hypothetical protein
VCEIHYNVILRIVIDRSSGRIDHSSGRIDRSSGRFQDMKLFWPGSTHPHGLFWVFSPKLLYAELAAFAAIVIKPQPQTRPTTPKKIHLP